MRHGLLLICAIAVALLLGCSQRAVQAPQLDSAAVAQDALVGTWYGVDEFGERGSFHFYADGTGQMGQGNVRENFSYNVDYTKKPIWLDLVNEDGSNSACIIAFQNADTLLLRTFMSSVRPDSFPRGETSDTIVLHRVVLNEQLQQLRSPEANPFKF